MHYTSKQPIRESNPISHKQTKPKAEDRRQHPYNSIRSLEVSAGYVHRQAYQRAHDQHSANRTHAENDDISQTQQAR